MIDIIALWLGRIILGTILLFVFSLMWYFIIKHTYNRHIEIKALAFAIASNMKMYKKNKYEKVIKQTRMRVGTKWWVTYKGKNYLWECIGEVEK